jgi:hypothetical protein
VNFIWLYELPNWLLCFYVVTLFTVLSLVGFWVTHAAVRAFKVHHNDVVASFAASSGVLYAVLLAMIAVASWTNYTTVGSLVSQEADLVHQLFRDAGAYPPQSRVHLRGLLREYVGTVVNVEWPALQHGVQDQRAGLVVDDLFDGFLQFEPKTEGEKLIGSEALSRLNTFQAIRRNRIQTGQSGLDGILWMVVLCGAILNVGMCYLFRIENKFLHELLIGTLGLMIGVVVYLILALDHPLWGEVSVQPTAFHEVAESMDRVLHPLTAGERRLPSH